MKIELKIFGRETASLEVPDNLMIPDREDLSVVPLICGMVIGMILPFGLMVFMKELLSLEIEMSIKGMTCVVSPMCGVVIVAIVTSAVLVAWLIYVLWKRWRIENSRRCQKQSLDFIAGAQERFLRHISNAITVKKDSRGESESKVGDCQDMKTPPSCLSSCIMPNCGLSACYSEG